MTLHLWLLDLAAYSAQIAAMIGIGVAVPYALRVRRPGALLVYRQLLLAVCLLLPLLQPWRRPVVEDSSGVTISTGATRPVSSPSRRVSPEQVIAWTLCAGVLMRLLWLGAGLLRLRRYRLRGERLEPAPAIYHDLQLGLRTPVAIGVSADISSPVAFGIRRPMILMPPQFMEMSGSVQEAIVCHEMAHIRRGDWAVTMLEELIRALLWFHPFVWWLLSQIQLNREQVVDCEVIDFTRSRDEYVDALIAVAGVRWQPDLAPASLFLQKSGLTQRISLILKGASMSRTRLISSLAATCGALIITLRLAILCFPINAPAQEVVRGEANLLHRMPIEYPAEAQAKGIQGTVVVRATLNERGVVTDAQIVSGPDILRKAALQSVLEWHYNAQGSSLVEVAIDFKLPVERSAKISGVFSGGPGGVIGGSVNSGRLTGVRMTAISSQLREALTGRIPVREGDEIQPDTLSRVRQAVRDVDEHLDARLRSTRAADASQEISLDIFLSSPPTQAPVSDAGPGRIRVGGAVQAAMIVSSPRPDYPPDAKRARVQGVVRFNVVIGKDGTLQDIKVESGHPLLISAAMEAVRQWKYQPTLLNGSPVEVATVVDVNFTLAE